MPSKILLFNLPPVGGNFYPISLGYIAASLTREDHECAIAQIDEVTLRTGQSIANFALDFKPRIVGFSVYQANIKLAIQLARLIKMIDRDIFVVIGGPQATFMPKEALISMRPIDAIVKGEGEAILPSLARCIESNGNLAKVKGIVIKNRNTVYQTGAEELIRDLDELPSPYRAGAFDLSQQKTAVMLTSRGCSFNCSFCYTPQAYRRSIRAHSAGRVFDDIQICVKNNIHKIFFADPSFTYDKKRSEIIMKGIIKRKWKLDIWCQTRADLIDRGSIALMAKAGVKRIAYGLESVDPVVNKAINKKIDLGGFEDIIKITQDLGIQPEVFTLYGLPRQTYRSCLDTIDFLKRLGIELKGNSAGQQMDLFFGTEIARDPRRFGVRVTKKRFPPYLSAGTNFVTGGLDRGQMRKIADLYKT